MEPFCDGCDGGLLTVGAIRRSNRSVAAIDSKVNLLIN